MHVFAFGTMVNISGLEGIHNITGINKITKLGEKTGNLKCLFVLFVPSRPEFGWYKTLP